MRTLIVGGDSTIGRALNKALTARGHEVAATSRRPKAALYLDLLHPFGINPASYDAAFLCAGLKGFKECERDPLSWRVNVDGVLAVAKRLMRGAVHVAYVSTDAIEWSDAAYASQRAHVEIALQAFGDPIILRCERFDERTAPELADFMIDAVQRGPGIYRWPGDKAEVARIAA